MKDIIFSIILFILVLLFVGHFSISFKPFHISLPYWGRSLALVLVYAAVVAYHVGEYSRGYREGYEAMYQKVMELIEKKYKEQQNEKEVQNNQQPHPCN